jgi:hypothetical protein
MRTEFNCILDLSPPSNVNQLLETLTQSITKAVQDNCTVKKYELKSKSLIPEWANGNYFKLIKRIDNIDKKIIKLSNMQKPTSKLKHIQDNVKDKLANLNASMAKNYYSNLIKNYPAHSWVVVNKILGKPTKGKSKIVLTINDVLVNDESTIAETFADYFSETVSSSNEENVTPTFIGSHQSNSMVFDPVTCEEVYETILSINSNKAPGCDSIPAKILKEIVFELTAALTDIINVIVMTSTYSDQMKYAHVIPLFKNGEKNVPENYRGISLLTILNKIVEKIILNRMRGLSLIFSPINVISKTNYVYNII